MLLLFFGGSGAGAAEGIGVILRAKLVQDTESLWLTDESGGLALWEPPQDDGSSVVIPLHLTKSDQGTLSRKLHEIDRFLARAPLYEEHKTGGGPVELWVKIDDGVDEEPVFGRGWLRRRVRDGRVNLPRSYGRLLADSTLDMIEVVCETGEFWYGRKQYVAFAKHGRECVSAAAEGGVTVTAGGWLTLVNPSDCYIGTTAGTVHLVWAPGQDSTYGTDQYIWREADAFLAYFRASDDKIVFTDGTNTIASASAQTFSAGDEITLDFTWSGSALKVYKNGASHASGTFTAPGSCGTITFLDDGTGLKPGGTLYDVRIWNSALTAAQIALLYAAGRGHGELPYWYDPVHEAATLANVYDDGMSSPHVAFANVPGDLPADLQLVLVSGSGDYNGQTFIGKKTRRPSDYIPAFEAEDVTAVLFNGTTTSVTCGSDAGLDNLHDAAFTAEAWVKPRSAGEGSAAVIMSKTNWTLRLTSTLQLYGEIKCATTDATFTSVHTLAPHRWHHVAMCWDDAADSYPQLFIDGVLQDEYISRTARSGAVVSDAAESLYIGNNAAGSAAFDGWISWCRVSSAVRYTVDFTPTGRTVPPSSYANTAGQWNFDEGSGTTLDNEEGTAARDGTLSDGTWKATYYGTNVTTQASAGQSGGAVARKASLSSSWASFADFVIYESMADIHRMFGRYRVLARVYDHAAVAGALQVRFRPWLSSMDQTYCANLPYTTAVTTIKASSWQMLDCGVIDLPPMRVVDEVWDGSIEGTTPTTTLKAMFLTCEVKRTSGNDNVDIDFIMLLPAEEEGRLSVYDDDPQYSAVIDTANDDPPLGSSLQGYYVTGEPRDYAAYEGDPLRLEVGSETLLAVAWRHLADSTNKHVWTIQWISSVYAKFRPRFRWMR